MLLPPIYVKETASSHIVDVEFLMLGENLLFQENFKIIIHTFFGTFYEEKCFGVIVSS